MRKLLEKWKWLWGSDRTKYYAVTAVFVLSVFFFSGKKVIRLINNRF